MDPTVQGSTASFRPEAIQAGQGLGEAALPADHRGSRLVARIDRKVRICKSYPGVKASHQAEAEGVREILDELHLRKIDLSDEVLVVNVNGYVGESTRNELAYAKRIGRAIRYMEC